ncbi:MAG: hypothetical protein IJK26_09570 [Clostridia bacterium]|nr:hypothetical protein [Clostridia bacterium]
MKKETKSLLRLNLGMFLLGGLTAFICRNAGLDMLPTMLIVLAVGIVAAVIYFITHIRSDKKE